MFVRVLGNLPLDLLPCGVVRQRLPASDALVGDEAALLGDRLEREGRLADDGGRVGAAVVPAELVYEQGAQVECLQQLPDGGSVQRR